VDEDCHTAYLFRDVTCIPPLVPQPAGEKEHCEYGDSRLQSIKDKVIPSDVQVSLEIKVKNGLKSRSPFVKNRIKHELSRYQLNQYAKQYKYEKNKIGMKYGGKFPGISQYDPADICSRDSNRVLYSLGCLLQNPQNNLKICSNGSHIYGLNITEKTELTGKCSRLLSRSTTPVETLKRVVAEILCAESALTRLSYVQSLDILDVEGAYRVYEVFLRQVSCTDEYKSLSQKDLQLETLAIVADGMVSDMSVNHTLNDGVKSCIDPSVCLLNGLKRILRPPNNQGYVSGDSMCRCLLHRLQKYQVYEVTSAHELELLKEKCVADIDSLAPEECLFLLKLYLISLAASDASVVLSLREASDVELKFMQETTNDWCTGISSTVSTDLEASCQLIDSNDSLGDHSIRVHQAGSNGMGYVSVRCTEAEESAAYFIFQLTFIDLGPKPAGKIIDKMKKEEKLCLEAESVYREV
jgi:hypothetical protein